MCVVALAWKTHPDWPLVLIGNRDELHARQASPLAAWNDGSDIIAGRDEQSGGTWLGVSPQGRLAVITNRRNSDGRDPTKLSRGALVTDALKQGVAPLRVEPELAGKYNGFSLLAVDQDQAWLIASQPQSGTTNNNMGLVPNIYGLANGDLDEPWPKTIRIKDFLAEWLDSGKHDPDRLLNGLREDDRPQVTPDRAEQSPIFIHHPVYGTRCSTVILVDADGKGQVTERRYDPEGKATGQTALDFVWPVSPITAD
ncbi:MAG: NRDE family protein [Pseudomonadota bacterium]